MAIPATIVHNGSLSGSPAPSGSGLTLQEIFNTSFVATFGSSKSARPSIVGATDAVPFVIPFETITKVRAIALKTPDRTTIKVKITSAVGTDQVFNVSGIWLWTGLNSGDEITAIKLIGSADTEYLIAGDV